MRVSTLALPMPVSAEPLIIKAPGVVLQSARLPPRCQPEVLSVERWVHRRRHERPMALVGQPSLLVEDLLTAVGLELTRQVWQQADGTAGGWEVVAQARYKNGIPIALRPGSFDEDYGQAVSLSSTVRGLLDTRRHYPVRVTAAFPADSGPNVAGSTASGQVGASSMVVPAKESTFEMRAP